MDKLRLLLPLFLPKSQTETIDQQVSGEQSALTEWHIRVLAPPFLGLQESLASLVGNSG